MVIALVGGIVTAAVIGVLLGFRTGRRSFRGFAKRQEETYRLFIDAEHRRLRENLARPIDWVIVGTRDPGAGVVLTVGQEPVKFDMLRRLEKGWQPGPLGAKLPIYSLNFTGQTENFMQIRGDTYEDALKTLIARRG